MAREFTRDALYELVWSKPIVQIAKDFALSDVAVHKICRKHDIPTPPVGWWAKKQAGKSVKQAPLSEPAKGAVDRIVIAAPELRKEASPIATIREEARVKVSQQIFIDFSLATFRADPADSSRRYTICVCWCVCWLDPDNREYEHPHSNPDHEREAEYKADHIP